MDTIFALSSGTPPCGVSVMRISGDRASDFLDYIGYETGHINVLKLASIHSRNNSFIDRALVTYFKAPKSFTGFDTVEIQCHGSVAVISLLRALLLSFDGFRDAEPGEFTQQAFINGKIDLTASEGLADLIHAHTEEQLKAAHRQADGKLYDLYSNWSSKLLEIQGLIEAGIDFSDEDDVSDMVSNTIKTRLNTLQIEIDNHVAGAQSSRIIRDGFNVVIAGPPNVGKSSLLNCVTGDERSIVSSIAGTTRDYIESKIILNGYVVNFIDTAGIRNNAADIEAIGIERSLQMIDKADLVLLLNDRADFVSFEHIKNHKSLKILTKSDILDHNETHVDLVISSKNNNGIDQLKTMISEAITHKINKVSHSLPLQERHIGSLKKAIENIILAVNHDNEDEFMAEYIRLASAHLGRITGVNDVEDMLGVIFSRFCIGK